MSGSLSFVAPRVRTYGATITGFRSGWWILPSLFAGLGLWWAILTAV